MSKEGFLLTGLALLLLLATSPAASTEVTSGADPRHSEYSFAPGSDVGATADDAYVVVAGDLDNDGDADLVSGDASGAIIVWQNKGTPFGGLWSSSAAGNAGDAVYALALSDLDHDGDLDIISGAGNGAVYEVAVWQNDGTPFDSGWTGNGVGGASPVRALAVADLDHDALPDIISGDVGAVIGAWRNDGTPFTGLWTTYQMVGNTTGPTYGLDVADLDNDGDLDIASGDANRQVLVWQNDGTPFSGVWTSNLAGTSKDAVNTVALADLNGDGDVDIVSDYEYPSATDYKVAAWQNDGSPWAGTWSEAIIGASGDAVNGVAVGDLDNDGDPDVMAGAGAGGSFEVLAWYNPVSTFVDPWPQEEVGASADDVFSIALADLDRDGDLDAVSASGSAEDYELIAWQNTAAALAFGSWVEVTQPAPVYDSFSVSLADFDHDGALDIAAGMYDKGVLAWRGNGGSVWTRVGASDLPDTGTWRAVDWGQINNRVEIDLATASKSGGLSAWLAWEAGGAWDKISTGLPASGDYHAVTLGDLDNDGNLDLVGGGDNVGVGLWQGVGGTSWSLKKRLDDGQSFCDLRLGHVNHDGNLDVVAAHCGGGGVRVWLSDGGWGFSSAAAPASTGDYQAVAVGDINRDGWLDVAAAASSGKIGVWAGDGGSSWSSLALPPTSEVFNALDLGDFDHDGYLDLLAAGKGLLVWQGNGGTGWTEITTGLPTSGSFYDADFGPVDGDAALDIVAAEMGASGVRVWTAFEPPPGGWSGFAPTGWMTSQTVTATVSVADAGSGLDVSTAEYRFSRDGGATWVGGWQPATCTGSDGTTDSQTITAAGVPFNQDSDTRNVIQFRIQDMAGLTGTSDVYHVAIDSTPPTNPTDLNSPDHTAGEWSNDQSIHITWSDEGYDALSGIWGYSWRLNRTAVYTPDTTVEQGAGPGNLIDLWAILDGDWYFHFWTRDRAGNWADPEHLGPYRIDTTPPTTPTLVSSSHTIGGWSNDNTIWINWSSSDGGGSGVAGYSYVWHQVPSHYVDTAIDTTASTMTSDPLSDGQWYLHIRAIDQGGSASGIAHIGPFGVDTTDPYGCWINSPYETTNTSFLVEWSYLDATSGVASYDVQVRDGAAGSWTDWQMGTSDASATHTGAQNLHTYYFRVRARDRAGNLTGYDCQDQTTVELPPGVSDFTPTSGFASAGRDSPPLQLVPGTEVTINGSGLTGGVAYFNGVAMEPTLSHVVSDSQIQAVIGVGTPTGSGPVCVRSAFGEACSADDFEVVAQPFPVRRGLGFNNFTTPASDMGWDIFERAFGNCSVNFCPIPNPLAPWRFLPCSWCPDSLLLRRPTAIPFYDSTRDVADGGDCYGMSYLTLDFIASDPDPDDFAAGADIPASLSDATPTLLDNIRARQWRQKSLEASLARRFGEDTYIIGGPMAIHDLIETELDHGRWPMLCFWDHDNPAGGRGHCVNPYAVTADTIQIYDNNDSYVIDGDWAMQRTINVSDAGWSYGTWGDDATYDRDNALFVFLYEAVDGPNTIPSDIDRFIFGSSHSGHFRVEDAAGHAIGYDASGQWIRTLTTAVPMMPFQQDTSALEGYSLGEAGEYTVYANGMASGTFSMTIFNGGGSILAINDMPQSANGVDAVNFWAHDVVTASKAAPAADSSFLISTSDPGKSATLTLYQSAGGADETRSFELEGIDIGSGSPLSLTTDSDSDTLVISGGPGGTYDVCFERVADGQPPQMFCWNGIDLVNGDRHLLTPEDWENLNRTRVRLDVDEGNDGSIDRTEWLTGHGLTLVMQVEPVVVGSGDLLTFTLSYTVTGGEAASGAVLSATLPLSSTFVSASDGVTPAGGVLAWALGDLTPPASGQKRFTVQVDPIPNDAVIGTLGWLRDSSGRQALASAAAVGPDIVIRRHDFDEDGQVTTNDIQAVASRWPATEADAGYDALYDVVYDGVIDMLDIMAVAATWGESYN